MLAGAVIPRNSHRAIQEFCKTLPDAMGARENERDTSRAELCFRAAAAIAGVMCGRPGFDKCFLGLSGLVESGHVSGLFAR